MKRQGFLLAGKLRDFFRKKGFSHWRQRRAWAVVFLPLLVCIPPTVSPAATLQADQVLVLVNTRMAGSLALAKYYMKERGIPQDNLLEMALTLNDTINREDYNDFIVKKVRKKLEKLAPRPIGALVTFYGMPLKIDETPLTHEEKTEIEALNKKIEDYEKQLASAPVLQQQIDTLRQRLNAIRDKGPERDAAAVDSELMLVRVDGYKLRGWITNPYFLEFQRKQTGVDKSHVMLVSRLDGPDLATVRRMIDDSIATEKKGLQGTAYLDARYPKPEKPPGPGDGYGFYDASIYESERILARTMPVTLDGKEELFPPHSCPNAALYCGWYSYGRYIDSFTWQPGAIGYHLASTECSTLRLNGDFKPWCQETLAHGAAATIGPIGEPYVEAFPPPHLFFALLVNNKLTLGESYLVSLPYISWQMILVGDPLYRPFGPAIEK